MLFAHPDPQYFNRDRCGLLDIIGRQSVIALQNAKLYQDLVEEKERMVEVQEEARKKLARDLHDGPTQSVAAMAMRVNLARRMMAKDIKEATKELVKIEELAHRTTKEIRHMLFTLRPLVLENQGLTAALEQLAEKMKETHEQNLAVRVSREAEKALDLMVSRGLTREAFGKKIAHLGGNLQIIAQARCEIEAMRLMVLKAAKAMDVLGNKEARIWVSMVKAMVPERTCRIIDQAIQMHGATGISQWSQLGEMYQDVRHLRFADGPDEVHWMVVGRHELSMP